MNQNIEKSLNGQVAIVTGASQGIGEAIAHQLSKLGLRMVLCARNAEKLAQLAGRLQEQNPLLEVLTQVCDVRNANQVEQVIQATLRAFGKIDILINNAGVAPPVGLLQEISLTEIDRTIDTNLKGAIYFMHGVIPIMVQHHGGTIININSTAGKKAYPFWSVYDASKFGLHAVTEAVAEEQRDNNIKVVGIYPGAVDTEIWEGLQLEREPRREGMLDPVNVAEAITYVLKQPQKVFIKELLLSPLKPVV